MTLTTPSSPHIKSPVSTARLMRDVLLALLPALAVGIRRLGLRGLFVTLLCVAVAVATEWVGDLLLKKHTVRDGSARLSSSTYLRRERILSSACWRTTQVLRSRNSASRACSAGRYPAASSIAAARQASASFIWQPMVQRW